MNSKEAIEILLAGYYNNANYQELIEAREKLEQDLERLDQLEKENEELKRLNKNLKNSNTHKDTYASKLKEKNERLLLILRGKLENDN